MLSCQSNDAEVRLARACHYKVNQGMVRWMQGLLRDHLRAQGLVRVSGEGEIADNTDSSPEEFRTLHVRNACGTKMEQGKHRHSAGVVSVSRSDDDLT